MGFYFSIFRLVFSTFIRKWMRFHSATRVIAYRIHLYLCGIQLQMILIVGISKNKKIYKEIDKIKFRYK